MVNPLLIYLNQKRKQGDRMANLLYWGFHIVAMVVLICGIFQGWIFE